MWRDHYFRYPPRFRELHEFLQDYADCNLYFGLAPLATRKRVRENVIGSRLLFADLDAVDPRVIRPRPTIAWLSSPNRYAAIWLLDEFVEDFEPVNKALNGVTDGSNVIRLEAIFDPDETWVAYKAGLQDRIFARTRLSAAYKVIGAQLLKYLNSKSLQAWPSVDRLHKETTIARSTIMLSGPVRKSDFDSIAFGYSPQRTIAR